MRRFIELIENVHFWVRRLIGAGEMRGGGWYLPCESDGLNPAPQNPQKGDGREPSPQSGPPTSTHILWHVCPSTHHIYTYDNIRFFTIN